MSLVQTWQAPAGGGANFLRGRRKKARVGRATTVSPRRMMCVLSTPHRKASLSTEDPHDEGGCRGGSEHLLGSPIQIERQGQIRKRSSAVSSHSYDDAASGSEDEDLEAAVGSDQFYPLPALPVSTAETFLSGGLAASKDVVVGPSEAAATTATRSSQVDLNQATAALFGGQADFSGGTTKVEGFGPSAPMYLHPAHLQLLLQNQQQQHQLQQLSGRYLGRHHAQQLALQRQVHVEPQLHMLQRFYCQSSLGIGVGNFSSGSVPLHEPSFLFQNRGVQEPPTTGPERDFHRQITALSATVSLFSL